MSDAGFPIPPPTFDFLVYSLKMQAEMHLGLMGAPEGEEAANLPAARHTIDMLAMLVEKTKGNLSLEEQRLIENSLTELRFRFVQTTTEVAKQSSGKADSAAAGVSSDAAAGISSDAAAGVSNDAPDDAEADAKSTTAASEESQPATGPEAE